MRGYEELQRNLQQEIVGLLQRNRELAKQAEEKQEKEGAADINETQKPQVQLDSPEGPISPEAAQLVTHVLLKNTDNDDDESSDINWDPDHEPLSGIEVHHVNGSTSTKNGTNSSTSSQSGNVNGHTNTPSSLSSKTQSSIASSSSSISSVNDPKASVGHTMQSVPISNHSSSTTTSSSSTSSSKSEPDGDHSPPGIRITDSIKLLTHPVQPLVNQGVAAAVAPAAALAGITVAPVVALATQSNPNAADDSAAQVESSSSSSTTTSKTPLSDDKSVHNTDNEPKSSTTEQEEQQQSSAIGVGEDSIPKVDGSEQSILKEELGDKLKSNVDIELTESEANLPEIFTEENPAYSSPSRDVVSLANGLVPPSSLATTTHYTTDTTLGQPRQTNRYMGKCISKL